MDEEEESVARKVNEFLILPEHKPLSFYLTYSGILSLTVVPFCQGLFQGIGEGTARLGFGYLLGLHPYYSLGGKRLLHLIK